MMFSLDGRWFIFQQLLADQEVAKMLIAAALVGKALQQGVEQVDESGFVHIGGIELGEAIAVETASQVEVVQAGSAAGEGNFRQIGPCTAVGAAGDSQGDRGGVEPM